VLHYQAAQNLEEFYQWFLHNEYVAMMCVIFLTESFGCIFLLPVELLSDVAIPY
jgi:hypothetical protein